MLIRNWCEQDQDLWTAQTLILGSFVSLQSKMLLVNFWPKYKLRPLRPFFPLLFEGKESIWPISSLSKLGTQESGLIWTGFVRFDPAFLSGHHLNPFYLLHTSCNCIIVVTLWPRGMRVSSETVIWPWTALWRVLLSGDTSCNFLL